MVNTLKEIYGGMKIKMGKKNALNLALSNTNLC